MKVENLWQAMAKGGKKSKKGSKPNRVNASTKKEPFSASVDECMHVCKAVKLNALQNSLPHAKTGTCKICGKGQSTQKEDVKSTETTLKDVCICLRCGQQGCSRQCKQQHAYQHYLTTPSHCVTLNIMTWVAWCYECDKELTPSSDASQLAKCFRYIKTCLPEDLTPQAENVVQTSNQSVDRVLSAQPKGLKNLGNTCFFNSVVQNLTQTRMLRSALKDAFQEEMQMEVDSGLDGQFPLKISITSLPGTLTQSVKDLLTDFSRSTQKVLSPGRLFGEISKKAPQFRGFQQHDSQELLRYLLDGMKTEEMKRIEKGIKDKLEAKEESGDSVEKSVKAHLKNARTFVDDIFGGVLVSTILCHQCRHISYTYDGFLDLSLPVSDFEKTRTKKNMKKFIEVKASAAEKNENKVKLENNEQSAASCDKKMSKHQRKMHARQERKARRSRDKSNICKDSRMENSLDDYVGDTTEATCIRSTEELTTESSESGTKVSSSTRQDENTSEATFDLSNNKDNSVDSANREHREAQKLSVSSDLTDDDDMKPEDHQRLSAITMGLLQSMVKSCRLDAQEDKRSASEYEDDDNSNKSDEEGTHGEKTPTVESLSSESPLAPPQDGSVDHEFKETRKCTEAVTTPRSRENTERSMSNRTCGSRNSVYEEATQTVGLSSHTSDLVCGREMHERNDIGQKQPNGLPVEMTDIQETHFGETTDALAESKYLNSVEMPDNARKLEETKNSHLNEDDPMVEQLANVIHEASFEVEEQSTADTASECTQGKLSNYDCDSGFSSIGEIYSETATTNEDFSSDIEDFTDVKVPSSSVLECFKFFCSVDILDGKNKFACENCLKLAKSDNQGEAELRGQETSNFLLTEATKQFLIAKPPKILTLHLKRFEQTGRQLRKINRQIEFPLLLDITPFCHRKSQIELRETKYRLYGLVEHSGSLHGGHYVAYVFNSDSNTWFFISDARVSVVSEEVVLRKQAYLLFYEQIDKNTKCGMQTLDPPR